MATKKETQEALLHKVDTLLKRHRVGAVGLGDRAPLDAPVLTDIVDDDIPVLQKSVSVAPSRANDKALHGLAADIYDRVLQKLEAQIAAQFERKLAAQIERAVRTALQQIGTELKDDLVNSVGDVIAEALAEKLNHGAERKNS
jgi:predicted dinucleotide-utilizing enzyme